MRRDLHPLPHSGFNSDWAQLMVGLSRGELSLVGSTRRLDLDAPDWRLGPQSHDRLWTITLHYHAWLEQLAGVVADGSQAKAVREQAGVLVARYLSNWIDCCTLERAGARDLVWNAYAIATRLGHWVRLHRHLSEADWQWGGLHNRLLESMWRQAAYLHENLEWDLRGNHLLRDAVGLAWAGRFFEGAQPRRWMETATALALEQTREQVMSDGGHFERSPMYHLQAMNDFHSLSWLLDDSQAAAGLKATAERMAACAQWLVHPDGEIALFNDAAIVPGNALAHRSATGSDAVGGHWLRDWGMTIWRGTRWAVFFDVGDVGPDHQPGHGHADTLSIECSYNGRRLFVDPGTFAYDLDWRRRYDRSTAAHNTVCIDDTDSSEVWQIFRLGRRARVRDVSVELRPGAMTSSASHDGYRFLPGRPKHARCVAVDDTGPLRLTDRVEGKGIHRVTGGLLLAPHWRIVECDGRGWRVVGDADRVRIDVASSSSLMLNHSRSVYHPCFGVEQRTTRLNWRYEGPLPVVVEIVVSPG